MIHLIYGAPCAGKSTYVKDHAKAGEIIIDADAIAETVGAGVSHRASGACWEAALEARRTLIDYAKRTDTDAWIIHSAPSARQLHEYRRQNAEVVLVDPGVEECLRRAEERPEGTADAVKQWYDRYAAKEYEFVRNVSESDTSQYDVRRDGKNTEIRATALKRRYDMNDQPKQTTTEDTSKTFTQADMDAAVEARLSRERAKYADYEALKEKAAKFDKAEEAAKSELQKAQDLAADYKAKLDAREKELTATLARDKVSAETGVPAALLTGESEESCKAQAEALLKWRGAPKSAPNRSVDHLLSSKASTSTKSDYEAGLLKMSGELFRED